MLKISAQHRLMGTGLLLLLSVLLNLGSHYAQKNPQIGEFYPFYNWRLMPFPEMNTPKEHLLLIYKKQVNLDWEVFFLKKHLTQFGICLKKYEANIYSNAQFKAEIATFFPYEVYDFKIVREIYYPQEIIRGQHEVFREDFILFE